MAHVLYLSQSNPRMPLLFNVDGVVGAPPATNGREDVMLVQFYFQCLGAVPGSHPKVTEASKAVRPTGTIDAATIHAIRIMQESYLNTNPRKIVDGRVSPAKGLSYGEGGNFLIVSLNHSVQVRYMDIWPRIDKITGCPGEVQQMVFKTLRGTA